MSFSQAFIEKVRESVNIIDLIGQYTELKPSGGRHFGLCPFPDHNEKTPSFSATEDKQLYHCFGCGKGGNVFTFLKDYRGLSFPEAVEFLADRAGIPIEREERAGNQFNKQKSEDKKLYLKMNKLTADYYSFVMSKLPESHPHRGYIERRNLTPEIIEKFQLGISPEKWQALTDVLVKRQAPLDAAEKLGLVKKKKQGEGHFDLFRDRLMFPILSPSGDVLGFGGRTFGDDHPKYLNSPETPVFNKGKTFYGLHETAKYIRTEDEAIIVEGYMDLLALYGAGVRNVVAVLGTALTEHHAKALSRYTKNVTVLFDGDAAGRRAAERSLSILLSQGLFPKEVVLPDGQDPDDFLKAEGAEKFKEVLRSAPEFYTAFLDRCFKENGSSSMDKVRTIDKVGPILRQVADERLRELYFRETIDRMGVSEEWLKKALRDVKTDSNAAKPQQNQENAAPQQAPVVSENTLWPMRELAKAELQLLQLGLSSSECWQQVLDADVIEEMEEPAKAIFSFLQSEYRQNPQGFDKLPALLASRVDLPNFVTLTVSSTESTEQGEQKETNSKLIQDCIKWVNGRFLRAKSKELAAELKGQPTAKQLEQFMNVQKRKRSLNR